MDPKSMLSSPSMLQFTMQQFTMLSHLCCSHLAAVSVLLPSYAAQPFFLRYHATVASALWMRMPMRASSTYASDARAFSRLVSHSSVLPFWNASVWSASRSAGGWPHSAHAIAAISWMAAGTM